MQGQVATCPNNTIKNCYRRDKSRPVPINAENIIVGTVCDLSLRYFCTMSTEKNRQPLNTEEILPQMMEELMKVKAEKNALVSLIGFLLKKIRLPQEEQ